MTKEFEQDIKDFLYERLWAYEENSFHGCDLRIELTEEENIDGCWKMYYDEAEKYIGERWDDASETYEYYIDNFGNDFAPKLNPFGRNSCMFTFFMLQYGVDEILSRSKFIDDHWDEEIKLTEETIETILSEIGA